MTIADAIFDLKSAFVCEVLNVSQVYLVWTSRHLQEGRRDLAVAAFEKLVSTVRTAAPEMAAIRAALVADDVGTEAATEWRAEQTSRRREVVTATALTRDPA